MHNLCPLDAPLGLSNGIEVSTLTILEIAMKYNLMFFNHTFEDKTWAYCKNS